MFCSNITIYYSSSFVISIRSKVFLLPIVILLLLTIFDYLPPADSYLRHPNSYLPRYNIQSETDGESAPLTGGCNSSNCTPTPNLMVSSSSSSPSKRRQTTFKCPDIGPQQIIESDEDPEEDDEDVPSYGFPAQQKRRNRRDTCDLDLLMGTGSKYCRKF